MSLWFYGTWHWIFSNNSTSQSIILFHIQQQLAFIHFKLLSCCGTLTRQVIPIRISLQQNNTACHFIMLPKNQKVRRIKIFNVAENVPIVTNRQHWGLLLKIFNKANFTENFTTNNKTFFCYIMHFFPYFTLGSRLCINYVGCPFSQR